MAHSKGEYGFRTLSVHAGEEPDVRQGAAGDVVVPLHLSTTFVWRDPSTPVSEFEYIRSSNPTRKAYESKLASLEKVPYALAFASGLAAETAVLQAFIKPGDHIIAFDDLYGGTRRLFEDVFHGLEVSYVDLSIEGEFEKVLTDKTAMVWIESPTNPLIKICDIVHIAAVAKSKGVLTVVDNTFLSPYFQNPAELGADIIVHSSTKYIGGHSDVLGGAVLTADETIHQKVKDIQNNAGAVLGPFDCYLNIRGLKTLALRMEQHQKNALQVARFLEAHPRVKRVIYPGLESHPNHKIISAQASGYGGMLSFELEGQLEDAKRFLTSLKLFTIAESLGGVESLIELPTLMTHVSVEQSVKDAIGITDTLIRVSVGIEDCQDLIDDLRQALDS